MINDLKDILFGAFSRRGRPSGGPKKSVSPELRNKVMLLCFRTIEKTGSFGVFPADPVRDFLEEIRQVTLLRRGSLIVHKSGRYQQANSILDFLSNCTNEEFLDFVEDIFRTEAARRIQDVNSLVQNINLVFRSEDLAFELTNWVTERIELSGDGPYGVHGGGLPRRYPSPELFRRTPRLATRS